MLLRVVVRAQKALLTGCDLAGRRNRAVQIKSLILCNASPSSSFSHPAPLKSQPEDAGKAGQDTHGYHSVAGFHTVGTTVVAQGSLAAAGGNTSYADVQVNCWAKCRTPLGNTLATVIP